MSTSTMSTSTKAAEPVPYIRRSHEYYEAQGFERRYNYAHFDTAPFAALPKPLSQCTLGLVTTASTYARAPLEPRKVDSGPTTPPPETLYTSDLSWDKQATHTDDVNTFCPIEHLQALVAEGVIGALAPRFHCAPTEYSHRMTLEKDAPELHRRLLEDGADIALLGPL
ncbi:MAG TPA: hypothetical protein VIS76_14605 [Pseudomonadales bacterium]